MADQFGSSTQQNILTGGDGAKSYNWNVVNSANASAIDVNISNAGYLTMAMAASANQYWYYNSQSATFVYQNITGDFDIDVSMSTSGSLTTTDRRMLCVRDTNSTTNSQNLILLGHDNWSGLNTLWLYVIANAETGNRTTYYPYLRIARVGNRFNYYGKVNSGDSWYLINYYDSSFNTDVQVGFMCTQSAGTSAFTLTADYFQGTYTNTASNTTSTAAVTLPLLTIAATAALPATVSAALTLPHLTSTGASAQTGNFCNNALPMLTLDGKFAATADGLIEMPLPAAVGVVSVSNLISGLISWVSILINSDIVIGSNGNGVAVLPTFIASSLTAADAELQLPTFQTDMQTLTGRIAGTRVLSIPRFKINTLVFNQPIINVAAGFPVVNLSAGMLTGAGCQSGSLSMPMIKMPSLAYVNGYAGGVSMAAAAMPMFDDLAMGYAEFKGNMAAALPQFAIESLMSFREGSNVRVMALNINTGALTEYTAYDFNGFCQWGDSYFAEGEGGIYILGAETDDGVPISCSIKTSITELKNARGRDESSIKRVPQVHTVVKTPSPFVFKAITDDGLEHSYLSEFTEAARTDSTSPTKIKLGKGARGRYWQFAIENTAGAPLEIEQFEPEVAALERRV
ncbi:MAG: hypothetical protein L7F77_09575 [Candidatus Magnetominusculus sp. LBB02]|nr:hypothetical protein [Candidatus Magnetominusculus sp. LBB02]